MTAKFFCKYVVIAFLLVFPFSVFAEKSPVYISPNNDGVRDTLVVPIKISDKRYIQSWSLVIQDKDGTVVRTIGNKIALPEKLTFKGFFKQLVTPKQGVVVPASVTWNGVMDNGETAPDGDYYYYLTASDDNGNVAYSPDIKTTSPLKVIVDNTPPEISLDQPSGADLIFGEGAKSELPVNQSGSAEDLWIGKFLTAAGTTVRTIKWSDSEPEPFTWSGTDDNGAPVADGIYSYIISAVDRAGNSSPAAQINNIIFSAEKPQTNIAIDGSRYFSPGTESPLSAINLAVTIPVPDASSGNRLTEWAVDIIGSGGKVFCSFKSDSASLLNPPEQIIYDGSDDDGKRIPEGRYQARVTARYLNGYEPVPVLSPVFILDVTKPEAVLRASDKIFSPDGDGVKDTITVSQLVTPEKGAPVKSWTGAIVSAEDSARIVKHYDLGEFPADEIVWNGIDDGGNLAQDGAYNYILSAADLAGNTCRTVTSVPFTLDTSRTEVLLTAADTAFSPNNDRVKDTLAFTVTTKTKSAVSHYEFSVKDSSGTVVRTLQDTRNLPGSFSWDGKDDSGILCPDGVYTAALSVQSESGSLVNSVTRPFTLDTKAPFLAAAVPWAAFSPDGDGNQDTIPVTVSSSTDEKLWTVTVLDSSGSAVRKFTWQHMIETKDENGTIRPGFDWDGTDEAGNIAPDGIYTIVITSQDAAGNSFSTELADIDLDTRETKAYITASETGISPNGDSRKDSQLFTVRTTLKEGISSWNFDIRRADGTVVRSWSDKDQPDLPAQIIWDGFDQNGTPAEGTFTGTLSVRYAKGNHVSSVSPAFLCSVTPPVLQVATAPEYFSPDNDGTDDDLFIKLSGESKSSLTSWSFTINNPADEKPFWTISGTSSITNRIIWDGKSNTSTDANGFAERVQSAMDYPWHFTATDDLGMTSSVSGKIPVDVLVIRDGNVLKMAVPSIIFRSNYADFKTSDEIKGGLDPEKAANNERILKRVTEILNKFRDYKVTIVGHANRTTDNEEEETVENQRLWGPALIPLSQNRADYVRDYLVNHGVSFGRLTTKGMGGTQPVADWKDKDNNWKNRRVEFILQK